MNDTSTTRSSRLGRMLSNRPPVVEIFIPKELNDHPPLHVWNPEHAKKLEDHSCYCRSPTLPEKTQPLDCSPKKPVRSKQQEAREFSYDLSPKLPLRSPENKANTQTTLSMDAVEDSPPRKPCRTASGCEQDHTRGTLQDPPSFLSRRPAGFTPRIHIRDDSSTNREEEDDNVDIAGIQLRSISFSEDSVGKPKTEEGIAQVLQNVVAGRLSTSNFTKDVTLLYCIRHASCGQCREHGMQLSELVDKMPNVDIFGVLKKPGVDDKALYEFYSVYFNFPLFRDESWDLFIRACGNRKLSIWSIIRAAPRLASRCIKKGIRTSPFGGDLFTQGGLLLFDKSQNLRFIYYEKFGEELDLEAIEWAIDQCKTPLDAVPTKPPRRHSEIA